jgi:glycosyltransferase involved in cell wall biosynthesis
MTQAEESSNDPGNSHPRVSIGLPVFNGMPYLPEAIASLLDQDEPDIEVIISDNASEDGTEAHCRAVAARDARVRYFRNDVNRGAAANFQQVLSLSSAPYFAWAAHDDVYARNFVSACLNVLQARPRSALCVPAHRRVDETGTLISVRQEPPGLASSDLKTRLQAHLSRRAWLTIYGLWRKEILTRVGPPLPIWGSDVILVWRALLLAPVETIAEPLGDYRVFREKTADATILGLTAVESRLHFPNTRMLRELKRASKGLGISVENQAVAANVLRRWVLTHHYRELAFSDLWLEAKRCWSEGARLRALALVPPLVILSPRMSLKGLRRGWCEFRQRRLTW